MTGKDRSVLDHLVWFNPMIRTTLRHAVNIDEEMAKIILGRMELEVIQQVERNPGIPQERLGGILHTRLHELMARSGSLRAEGAASKAPSEGDSPTVPDGPRERVEGVQVKIRARTETIRRSLNDLDELPREILRQRYLKGLNDSQIASELDLSSEVVSRMAETSLVNLLGVYLGPDAKTLPATSEPGCCQDFWRVPFTNYVRNQLDPDTTHLLESQGFKCRRCGGMIVLLHTILDVFRSGESAAGGTRKSNAGEGFPERESIGRSRLKIVGGAFATLLIGIIVALFVQSSVGREQMIGPSQEMTILQPVPVDSEFAMPAASPYIGDYERAVTAYEKGQYSVALGRWERLYTEGVPVPNLLLYLGVTQLLSGKVEEAAQTLVRHVPQGSAGIPYHFYRAQALLIIGRVEEAREELRAVLAGGESSYRDDAERQLTTLLSPRPTH
ncbi:MAG: hypothetical protein KJ970_04180 [Candidatus Eisenbacteria bacterium]|uniref:Sigma-70 family RNA polymerase sigma factor n=1 Tax=Eiseniibacteriota bacterium TaxID=2212470 RepID=A0A948RW58_UNCEI|nr:hypothetical protein [Candidatus Eisenbacteria bacterium]MBU1950436.1 hypothetical protein [Candidatus Eisenbacteria bacterium]MBU2690102.1 hypothetical protein [Candidatus Eisenbacteria bacterium]